MYDFITIDFETANRNMNSACSVGVTAVKGYDIVKKDYFLIHPPTDYFSPDNTAIHGLTLDDVKEAGNFSDVWELLKPYFANTSFVIAHNAQFDMSVLKNCANTYGIKIDNFLYYDSINIGHAHTYDTFGNSLEDVAAYYGIEICNHHNSLCDSETVANIVISFMRKNEYPNFLWTVALSNKIGAKKFLSVKATKALGSPSHSYSSVKISEIHSDKTNFDTSHPFCGKTFVFTGELTTLDRKAAMQKVADLGGIVKSAVSSKTDFLVVGTQDLSVVGENGLSTKEEKAYELIEKGGKIQILKENEFIEKI